MKKKHPGGRPPTYKPEYADMAKLCIEDSGFSMYKLAKLFNVSRSTIYAWIDTHKEFSDGVKQGRKHYEGIKIHKSLVKRAVGFGYNERTRESKFDPETNQNKLVVTKIVRKYYPPDIASIKHWQVNLDPQNWKDKQNLEIGVKLEDILAALPEPYASEVRAALSKLVSD